MKAAIPQLVFSISLSLLAFGPTILSAEPGASSASTTSQGTLLTFSKAVQPFVAANCVGCHNSKTKTANLDFQRLMEEPDYTVRENQEVWKKVVKRVRAGEMPPKGPPRPKPAQQATALKVLDAELARASK